MAFTVSLLLTLNKVESKVFCLTDSPPLTDCLQPLTLRCNVATLAICYRYFHANCSSELANYMPRFSTHSHTHSYTRVNQYLHSFFLSTGKLWNSTESVFSSSYDFKTPAILIQPPLSYYSFFYREPAIASGLIFITLFIALGQLFNSIKKSLGTTGISTRTIVIHNLYK